MSATHDERMTKKIAQLTKVIIALNTRLDDFEQEKRCLVEQYENEIDQIIADGKQQITSLQEQLQGSVPRAEHEKVIEAVKNQHDEALTAIRKQIEEERHAIEEERNVIDNRERAHQNQLLCIKQQLNTINQDVRTAKGKHQQQVVQLQRERMDLEAKIKTEHSQAAEAAQARAHAREAELQNTIRDLESQIEAEKTGKLASEQAIRATYEQKIADIEVEWQQRLDAVYSEAKNTSAMLENEVNVLSTQLSATKGELDEKSRSDEVLGAVRRELNICRQQLKDSQVTLQDEAHAKAVLKRELEQVRQQSEKEIARKEEVQLELDQKIKVIQDLDGYCKTQEASLEASAGEVLRLQSLVKSLQRQVSKRNQADTSKKEQMHNLEETIAQKESEINEIRENHACTIKDLKQRHTETMRDIKKEAKDSLDKLRSQHRREIEDLNSKIADVSQRALQGEQQLREQLLKASMELNSLQQRFDATSAALDTERIEHETARKDLERVTLLEKQLQSEKAKNMVAEDRLERLENDLKHQAKEAEDTAAITLQEQRLASEEHLAATLEAQKAKHNEEMEWLISQHEVNLRSTKEEANNRISQLENLQQSLQDKLRQAEQSLQDQTSKMENEIFQCTLIHKQQVTAIEESHLKAVEAAKLQEQQKWQEKVLNLEEAHSRKIDLLKKQHEEDLLRLRSEQEALSEKLTRGAEDEVQRALERAQDKHNKVLTEAQTRLEEKFARDLERQLHIQAINHEKEISKQRREIERELGMLQVEHSALIASLNKTKTALDVEKTQTGDLRHELDKAKKELAETREALETKVQELLTIRRESNEALQTQQLELQEQHDTEKRNIVEKYRLQFARAGEQSTKIQESLRQKILTMEQALNQLQADYDARPSRLDDIQRIQSLEERLAELHERLTVLASENERLNLEVVNREHTFNLMFKNSPIVQPAPPKGDRPSGTRLRSARSRTSAASIKL